MFNEGTSSVHNEKHSGPPSLVTDPLKRKTDRNS